MPHKLLKNREIQVTGPSENPRVGAERGPVRHRGKWPPRNLVCPWAPTKSLKIRIIQKLVDPWFYTILESGSKVDRFL